jgi:hypothetical protein
MLSLLTFIDILFITFPCLVMVLAPVMKCSARPTRSIGRGSHEARH